MLFYGCLDIFTVLSFTTEVIQKIFHSIKTKINAAAETRYGYFHAHMKLTSSPLVPWTVTHREKV